MNTWKGFFQGMGAGLAVAGVAFLVAGRISALRRRMSAKSDRDGIIRIDGARDRDPMYLSVRPPEEVSSSETLASEIPDFTPVSQRW